MKRFSLVLLTFVCVLLAAIAPARSQRPRDVEQQINALLAKMTLAERLGQLQQLDGEASGNFRPEHLDLARKGLLGSTLNVRGAQRTNQLQRVAVKESDVALVFVGESADMVGEAASRSSLDLPGRQMDLVKAIQATGKPTVVVLVNGRPLTIGWIVENVPSILEAWMAGTESGNAIADILFSDVNPGGKLPVPFHAQSDRCRSTTTT